MGLPISGIVQAEARELSRFLLKPILHVTALVASPFLAAAFLFVLLQKPALWSLIPLAIGIVLLIAGVLVWAIVRARLVGLAKEVDKLADSDILRPPP